MYFDSLSTGEYVNKLNKCESSRDQFSELLDFRTMQRDSEQIDFISLKKIGAVVDLSEFDCYNKSAQVNLPRLEAKEVWLLKCAEGKVCFVDIDCEDAPPMNNISWRGSALLRNKNHISQCRLILKGL